ncbi:Ribokinase-like protein [Nadsonia fulvescens var. elongata DSM 6958]|uniref:Ribokinase-like protein n=1 Tax=Nadsonia fulvescens var. elongata DSM 6958 TaxID=857566 RepID=A0A1E3PLN3_9ASCO|nr:Ribokinase-like protein [Nadsonia fulvescens var. elongata DSM 6958]
MNSLPLLFTSMGMFILDEIHFDDSCCSNGEPVQSSQYDIIGGAGTYGVIGARFFLEAPHRSKQIGWILDIGQDFPPHVMAEISGWQTLAIVRADQGRLTTRGWNQYGADEARKFKYLTEKIRIEVEDLIKEDGGTLMNTKCLHVISSPDRCTNIYTKLTTARIENSNDDSELIIMWEPVPTSCVAENLDAVILALINVDIFSPNVLEAALLFGDSEPTEPIEIERLGLRLIKYMVKGPHSLIILRAGKLGCVVIHKQWPDASSPKIDWYPAYHSKITTSDKIVDPTGCGNAFMGGFAIGYMTGVNGADAHLGAIYGNIAAGLIIEQIGMPKLQLGGAGSHELWNGETIDERLVRYKNWYNK